MPSSAEEGPPTCCIAGNRVEEVVFKSRFLCGLGLLWLVFCLLHQIPPHTVGHCCTAADSTHSTPCQVLMSTSKTQPKRAPQFAPLSYLAQKQRTAVVQGPACRVQACTLPQAKCMLHRINQNVNDPNRKQLVHHTLLNRSIILQGKCKEPCSSRSQHARAHAHTHIRTYTHHPHPPTHTTLKLT